MNVKLFEDERSMSDPGYKFKEKKYERRASLTSILSKTSKTSSIFKTSKCNLSKSTRSLFHLFDESDSSESDDGETKEKISNRRSSIPSNFSFKRGSIFKTPLPDYKRRSLIHLFDDSDSGSESTEDDFKQKSRRRESKLTIKSRRGSIFTVPEYGEVFEDSVKVESRLKDPLEMPPCLSPTASPRKESLFKETDYNGKKRGSIFQLFDDPYGGEEPRVFRLVEIPIQSCSSSKKNSTVNNETFKKLSQVETQLLRRQLLHKGEYRVLNFTVLFILSLITFGVIFMSAWHYNDIEKDFWVLYITLGVILACIGVNLVGVKIYFHYKRYRGNDSKRMIKNMIFENFGRDVESTEGDLSRDLTQETSLDDGSTILRNAAVELC